MNEFAQLIQNSKALGKIAFYVDQKNRKVAFLIPLPIANEVCNGGWKNSEQNHNEMNEFLSPYWSYLYQEGFLGLGKKTPEYGMKVFVFSQKDLTN